MKNKLAARTVVMLILSVFLSTPALGYAGSQPPLSRSVSLSASATKIKAPSISVKSVGNAFLRISWKKCKGAVKYAIYRASNGSKYERIFTTSKLQYDNIFLRTNTEYYYKVKAISKFGKESQFSKIKHNMITLTLGTYKGYFGVPDFGRYFDVPLVDSYKTESETVFIYDGGDLLVKGYSMEEVAGMYGDLLQNYGLIYTNNYYDPEAHSVNYAFERNKKKTQVIMGATREGIVIHVLV